MVLLQIRCCVHVIMLLSFIHSLMVSLKLGMISILVIISVAIYFCFLGYPVFPANYFWDIEFCLFSKTIQTVDVRLFKNGKLLQHALTNMVSPNTISNYGISNQLATCKTERKREYLQNAHVNCKNIPSLPTVSR